MLPDPLAADLLHRALLGEGYDLIAAAGYVVVVVLVLQLFSTTDRDDE